MAALTSDIAPDYLYVHLNLNPDFVFIESNKPRSKYSIFNEFKIASFLIE